ncbi:MAG: radical SAM family heme chaperone HemW [Pseudomonadota bacterium]
MLNLSYPPPLSLYIHYPWCVQKCPYCDFNSHQLKVKKENKKQQNKRYIDALINDLENELGSIWGRSIYSIFIGGGTPSLFEAEELDYLLCRLKAILNILPMTEITLEANPGTIDYIKFAEFRQLGINRLSIGIQSFNNTQLELLGRIHNSKDAIKSVENAHQAGFEQINLDLMFALPKQSLKQALSDVQTAIDLKPQHISYYQLTIEQNTFFAQQPPVLPSDDLSYNIQQKGHLLLSQHGFNQYEISAWSKKNCQCKHNINYWQFGDYLGIGAGAHGKITMVAEQTIYRNWKLKQPQQYLNSAKKKYLGGKKKLSESDLIFEFMLNASRLSQGFKLELFTQSTGLDFKKLQYKLNPAIDQGLISINNNIICPTSRGFNYLNNLQELFL